MNTALKQQIILIVEDEKPLLNVLTDRCTESGFEVITASNGEDGVKAATKHHPDLILLDFLMPKSDGMNVLQKLRGTPWGKTVPIIILTNLEPSDKVLNSIMEGSPSYYIMKSNIQIEDLMQKIKDVLSQVSLTM